MTYCIKKEISEQIDGLRRGMPRILTRRIFVAGSLRNIHERQSRVEINQQEVDLII
jgi:hypothetical protein